MAGVGSADILSGDNTSNRGQVFRHIREQLGSDPSSIRYFGGMCFDTSYQAKTDNEWQGFGTFKFILPRFELCREDDHTNFICNLIPHQDVELISDIIKELEDLIWTGDQNTDFQTTKNLILRRVDLPDLSGWKDMVNRAVNAISSGDIGKVVLARRVGLEFNMPLNALELLKRLKNQTVDSYHFCFQFDERSAFIGASPERLYKRKGRQIDTEALAGTRQRDEDTTADKQLSKDLLSSDKDLCEQRFVAEHVASTLDDLCIEPDSDIDRSSTVELRKLRRVQHLVTRFSGRLRDGVADTEIIRKLHPTPAVGGTPTENAGCLIRELESFSRGWYAGPVGWVGADTAEFAVGIRSGMLNGKRLYLFGGAGIVEGSEPDTEWNEIENKLSGFLASLE